MRQKRQEAPRETHMFKCEETGNVWELVIPDVMGYVMTGRMPQTLVTEFLESAEKRGVKPAAIRAQIDKITENISAAEITNSLIFMRELVREACHKPRIVPGGAGEFEIDPTEVDPRDFKEIFQWVLLHAGVAGIAGLQGFRPGRTRGTTSPRAHGQKLRKKSRR